MVHPGFSGEYIALQARINNQIRATDVRVLANNGENLGVMPLTKALALSKEQNLDLIEISPKANPPVVRLMEYGKWQYEENKKQKKAKAGAKQAETKSIQVKIGTGDHDLELKARQASKWLTEGHRIKVELFLAGRAKGLDEKFLHERLDRVLNLITGEYKIAEGHKRGPKGITVMLEKGK